MTFGKAGLVVLASAAYAAPVGGQWEISRHTIDGGGVMQGTGGSFELSGTIGQPDAGPLSSGSFELIGGFWFELAPADCNSDGVVTLADYNAFRACLSGPAGHAESGCVCFDTNGNGRIEMADFAEMQTGFSGDSSTGQS